MELTPTHLLSMTIQLVPYIDDVGVDKTRKPLVLADDSSVLIVCAVTVAPTPGFTQLNALLSSVTLHIIQPDLPCGENKQIKSTSVNCNTT